jgi:outer membrane receptor protein involved in Fe transport
MSVARRIAVPLLLLASAAAHAAPASVSSRVVYDAAYYAQFRPSTALDMIRETPGFALEDTSTRRGFSGASGNVLVDGEHPIAKSQGLADILQRIPAKQVQRIELLRGGEAAADASGHAVIANIVRTPSAGQGVYQLGFEYAGRTPVPNGWGSWSGRLGRTDYSVGFNGYSLLRNLPGERVRLDGSGARIRTSEDRSPRDFYQFALNGEASRPMLGGRVRVTGQAKIERYHEDSTIATRSLSGALTEFERNPYSYHKRTFEGGVEYDRPLGAWDLALSGLVTRRRFTGDYSSTHSTPTGGVDSIFTQTQVQDSGETIARATLSRTLGNHRIEAGAEGAINTLEQRLELTLDQGSGPFIIPIANANLRIVEQRGEAYVADTWTLGRWTLEGRLTGEASRLSFTGDTNQSVPLAYLKPSLQLTRKLGKSNQLRARLYRDVGQLDFTDFVSVASLSDDRINGGNPDLKPETSWRAELGGDFRFAGDGALSVTLFRHWVFDTADLVPVQGANNKLIDAPGNIGKADVSGAQLTLRLPLNRVLRGGSLSIDGTWQKARVTDPLTGERRTISGFAGMALKADFRQDLANHKLSWGATYTAQPTLTYYRVAEIERKRSSPSLDVWLETTAFAGLKTRLTILSLLGHAERRTRTFFAPNRTGAITEIERGARHPGRWVTLTVSGSF